MLPRSLATTKVQCYLDSFHGLVQAAESDDEDIVEPPQQELDDEDVAQKAKWRSFFEVVASSCFPSCHPQGSEFTHFVASIDQAIKTLGGVVYPQLNWSSPIVRS